MTGINERILIHANRFHWLSSPLFLWCFYIVQNFHVVSYVHDRDAIRNVIASPLSTSRRDVYLKLNFFVIFVWTKCSRPFFQFPRIHFRLLFMFYQLRWHYTKSGKRKKNKCVRKWGVRSSYWSLSLAKTLNWISIIPIDMRLKKKMFSFYLLFWKEKKWFLRSTRHLWTNYTEITLLNVVCV